MNIELKKFGLKSTPARKAILKILQKNHRPFSVDELHEKLGKKYDIVTLYRNMQEFEKNEIVFRESINRTDYFYFAQNSHHHIICIKCGAIACVPCNHHEIKVKNFKNINHHLTLSGVCVQCAA